MKLTASQLRRIIREEVSLAKAVNKDPQRFLHGYESGHPMDDEGYMIKSRMYDIKEMAETICDLLDAGDQLPGWVQDLVAAAHTDVGHVKDYLVGDEALRQSDSYQEPGQMAIASESRHRRGVLMSEAHSRITPDEMHAWMSGDWGYVSEASDRRFDMLGGKRMLPPPPGDPTQIANFISKAADFAGACQEMGCEMNSPEMRQYVGDQLADIYTPTEIDAAFEYL